MFLVLAFCELSGCHFSMHQKSEREQQNDDTAALNVINKFTQRKRIKHSKPKTCSEIAERRAD